MHESLDVIQIIFSIFVALFAIITFFSTRKKENTEIGNKSGELSADLKHMNGTLTDIRIDINEINHKLDINSERITRTEESVKQAHKRLNTLESKIERLEEK